jgi:hypothetical protein
MSVCLSVCLSVDVGMLELRACRAVSNLHPDNWQSVTAPGCGVALPGAGPP